MVLTGDWCRAGMDEKWCTFGGAFCMGSMSYVSPFLFSLFLMREAINDRIQALQTRAHSDLLALLPDSDVN